MFRSCRVSCVSEVHRDRIPPTVPPFARISSIIFLSHPLNSLIPYSLLADYGCHSRCHNGAATRARGRYASPFHPSTRYVRGTKFILSWTLWAVLRCKRIVLGWNELFRRMRNRSVGCSCYVSCSETGSARRRRRSLRGFCFPKRVWRPRWNSLFDYLRLDWLMQSGLLTRDHVLGMSATTGMVLLVPRWYSPNAG